MRYERKYTFFEHSIQSFRNRIKSLGFKLAFPTRQVSSLYYDTFDFKLYQISEAGISERKKNGPEEIYLVLYYQILV